MKKATLQSYKDAVWSYMLEHCDVLQNGDLFIKFRTKDRLTFERHIKGRWKYDYHRGDPEQKWMTSESIKFQHEREKYEAEIRHLKNKLRGRRLLKWRSLLGWITK